MALRRVWMPTNNYYQGYNARRLLVLHSSEGALTYQALGNFFATGTDQASSHVGIDDTKNTVGEYVKDSNSAWTSENANLVALQAELCAPSGASANWSQADWKSHPNMLQNTAEWLKEESAQWGIPLTKLTPAEAQGNGKGVCQHSDLGAWGGNHHDCGPGFPIDYVISLAKDSAPPATGEDIEMTILEFDASGNCPIVVPNDLTDGTHYLRFGCVQDSIIRVDPAGKGSTVQLSLGYDKNEMHMKIPAQCYYLVVRRLSGSAPIAMVMF
jgi:hypothetical protein